MRGKLISSTLALLLLSACSTAKLPDPTIQYPTPPAELMTPSENMQTIPTESNTLDFSC